MTTTKAIALIALAITTALLAACIWTGDIRYAQTAGLSLLIAAGNGFALAAHAGRRHMQDQGGDR